MTTGTARPLSHDLPCPVCGHGHHVLTCSDTCSCTDPPIPGITLT